MTGLTSRENLRASAAEFIATFTFVFVGVGSIGAARVLEITSTAAFLGVVGLGHGLGIMLGVMTVGRISGAHLNPAVTFAAWVTGNIGAVRGAMYVVAQLVAAALAVGALRLWAFDADALGAHGLGIGVNGGEGFVLEIILTFFLVFTIFAMAIDGRGNATLAPIAIGMTVAVVHFVAIPLTGASVNPARTFGPALVYGAWADHWLYWAGPLIGGSIAGVAYVWLFGDENARQRLFKPYISEPEARPSGPRSQLA